MSDEPQPDPTRFEFGRLLDWIEGRLPDDEAAKTARCVSGSVIRRCLSLASRTEPALVGLRGTSDGEQEEDLVP